MFNFTEDKMFINVDYDNLYFLFKEYWKLLNRLYNITWFGSVYA